MYRLPWADRIAAVASLTDAKRLHLFELVASSPRPLGRDDVAEAAGMARSTVSFHLDRLVQDGLLAVEFHKPAGRTGPGSGRPAKMYRTVGSEIGASVPDRNYDLAGELMATAIEASQADGAPVAESLRAAAFLKGRELAEAAGDLEEFLTESGYQPEHDGEGGYLLPNCPFHRLSRAHAAVVCDMNGAFLRGAAVGCGSPEERVAPAAGAGHCCARITGGD
ncbi:helix-turn-helix domain-containing protein [Arthrobacter sp. FX8]|jgi:predicted ArsR family transcriptional regulator|uniref:helix-turn-helix transcriptional regulator n=1 Tax=Arthrobacter sp. FX8 TaxID=2997335 RepID=UPI00227BE274|nr:helix-turn-helix domain-containing protein [Arthrobacter sp. FX8]WAJ35121.1 helix-turn-helix domain-containing protein [Arthrobacter sp. FX8]